MFEIGIAIAVSAI